MLIVISRVPRGLVFFLTLFLVMGLVQISQASIDKMGAAASDSTADHSKFEELDGPFSTGPEVTKACIGCHTEAAKQIHKTKHWTWQLTNPDTGQELGKLKVINNFCVAVKSNYARCTSCHVGYGWRDDSFDFASEENVDCVVCHDTTDTYAKFPTDAGHPPYVDKVFPKGSDKVWKAPDLATVAQSVGKTRRETCGACHFYGGGGDGVKHGDLDSSMTNPPKSLDVHLGVDGLNFTCSTCHTTRGHDTKGSRYTTEAKDTHGIDVPGREDASRATCESCHGMTPHSEASNVKLNDHSDKVACQTCHIPYFARGGKPTKMWWDWSTAGKMTPDGKHIKKKNEKGYVTYLTKKGDFGWGENVQPEYAWFNGDIRWTLLEDEIDPSKVVPLNSVGGSYTDQGARIWPFKVMRGKQPYDSGNDKMVIPHLFGKSKDAYWKGFDWKRSLKTGMQDAGAEFSGEYGFVETSMHTPLTHMVSPKEEALGCADCHSQDGRLAGITDFYMPGRDKNSLLDMFGWLMILGTLGGVSLHGLARIFAKSRRK